ncbi:jg27490, partial [Pararge aegeria aegeria]
MMGSARYGGCAEESRQRHDWSRGKVVQGRPKHPSASSAITPACFAYIVPHTTQLSVARKGLKRDYKADSAEISREVNVSTSSATSQNVNVSASEKPIARAWNNFKFQPDSNDPREIARFRTSIDEISCDTKMTA